MKYVENERKNISFLNVTMAMLVQLGIIRVQNKIKDREMGYASK